MKFVYCALASTLLIGCASKGGGEKSLIQQASAEHKCPPSEISVLNKREKNGGATYQLNVCGRQVYYYRINGAWVEASKHNPPNAAPPYESEPMSVEE